MKRIMTCLALLMGWLLLQPVAAQTELEPWGNLSGLRIDGQLMEVGSSLSVVKNWSNIKATGKEQQRPKYIRKGAEQVVTTSIDSLYFTESVTEAGKGKATVNVQYQSRSSDSLTGIFFRLLLPLKYYSKAMVQAGSQKAIVVSSPEKEVSKYLSAPVSSITFTAPLRQLSIAFPQPTAVRMQPITTGKNQPDIEVLIPIQTGMIQNGQTGEKSFTLTATGTVDKKPVVIMLNTATVGRSFDGLGGNFRLQNPKIDPQVIDYSLKNLNVTWGRVEMPWRNWQPAIDTNPIVAAKEGKLNPHVRESMEMAQRLYKMGMPVILTSWSAPNWAIVGPPRFRPGADGVWGNQLDHSKNAQIYQSIGDYVQYLKDAYGVEISMFSFNESDLGINIRQTGEEHAELIKGLGAYLVSRGLKTKLLLGDNSDATTYKFIDVALNDPATHPYIGAISFHSWRGWEAETLQHWADAATQLKLPLLVGEGSIDAQAWGYPMIFEEPTYALQEINLYTRLLAICQPASILQWQLTADYSPLAGGGIFGDDRPLQPTQRFWNLKQLSATPKGLKALPFTTSAESISCAAVGDVGKGVYAFHLVNNGPARITTLTGLPANCKNLQCYLTDATRSMQRGKIIPVHNGQAQFTFDATSYVTLISQ